MKDDIRPLTPGQREIMAKIGAPELTAANIAHGIPHDKREQRCQAVGGNAEGQVPTTALDEQRVSREAIRPPGSGADELEYWRGNAMHYHGLCVALEDEIDCYNIALEHKNAYIRRHTEWLEKANRELDELRAAHGGAIVAQGRAVEMMEDAERKLRICLRALDLLRRDSKSPDFVKVYCALIEDEISSGGGGAEQAGDEQGESQSGARSATGEASDQSL